MTAPGKLLRKRSHVEAFKEDEDKGDQHEEEKRVDDDGEQGANHDLAERIALAEENSPAISGKEDNFDVEIRCKVPDVPLATEYNGGEFYFVRACYDVYYKKVEDLLLNDNKQCVTVTGTPGIGKSIFYAYFLERFKKANPTWTIIASAHTPEAEVKSLAVFEPGEEAKHYRRANARILDIVTLEVLGVDLSDETTLDRYREKLLWLCDGPPKVAFRQTVVFTSPNERWLKEITNRGHLENLLTNRINTTTNHDFLHYEPIGDGRLVETKLVSEMVCKKLSERLLGVIEGRTNEVKALLDGIPPAASLRGSMFKAKAHAKLRDGLELENVIFDEVSPHSIKDIKGIKGLLDQGNMKMKENKHKSDWSRAVKRWESHKKPNKAENITMVKNIPQYVAPSD
ncbi:uncharacterized protein PITG_07685 [Phytophthora infestans T30-4]|uniref:Uncharacterized protein n=1 Tax=Phytophthora infestans (strain T30-4) TaxID=403677 RepID=D0N8W4_PHYIT|nr:uncharacterized protein PITG_07685 [Phytophthora infestans T30-4]EEY53999.1 conserved hypothetical protein [Phytophthora infestans T30-4]|eukprot:XP_002904630.1 conserved hypothetical protein [Phytophthora infestans T30-4]